MLLPKKQKYRRQFRGKMKGLAQRGNAVSFGEFGLKAMERSWITSRQIEASRKAITQFTKRGGKMWIRVFPDKPVTQKGLGVTMGSGKGTVDHYVAVVRPGKVLFELSGVSEDIAKEAFRRAGNKLPIKTEMVTG